MANPENASFAATLAEHRQQTEVPDETVARAVGAATFTMRLRGGYLTDCTVVSPQKGTPVTLFKTEEDLTTPELGASHTTCAIEGYDEDDDEGFPRWVDYKLAANGSVDMPIVAAQAVVGDGPFSLRKIARLHETGSGISTISILGNRTDQLKTAAIGEHFCFELPEDHLRGLAIGDVWLGHRSNGKEVLRRLESGDPHFFAGYQGRVLVDFPDRRRVVLKTSAAAGRQDRDGRLSVPPQRIGMVVRHTAGSGKLCLEPTLRRYDNDHNALTGGSALAPGFVVALTTSIDLIK